MSKLHAVLLLPFLLMVSCGKQKADLILYNGKVYTVNKSFDTVQAFAVRNGKIIAAGSTADIRGRYAGREEIDACGQSVYPGFIDAHAHFLSYGKGIQYADLREAKSWDEVCDRLIKYAKTNPDGWLVGSGWDQNDWPGKQFPDKSDLDKLFPNRPVFLKRIDGHAALVNQAALKLAGISKSYPLTGGEIVSKDSKLSGLLIDNAADLVQSKIPQATPEQLRKMALDAQRDCFAVGLTTVDDCGVSAEQVSFIEKLQEDKALKLRLYLMLSDTKSNYDYLFKRGAVKTDRLNVRAFKVFADGALGSRGACLLQPYHDMPDKQGFLLSDPRHFEAVARQLAEKNFQMCTHAIGDSANRAILRVYNKVLGGKNDRRWRIEHAQVVAPGDFGLFGKASIIPSVQPTHATSDMYWAEERLGPKRVKGAYAFKQLLDQNGWIPLGTDFPVEQINPMLTFFAATQRTDTKNYPSGGFQMENALTAEEALRGITIWAAKANFEEQEKGSLEIGKFADFVILNQDILQIPAKQILNTHVLKTYVNGEKVYEKK